MKEINCFVCGKKMLDHPNIAFVYCPQVPTEEELIEQAILSGEPKKRPDHPIIMHTKNEAVNGNGSWKRHEIEAPKQEVVK